jgi:hypothetical protein
MVYGQESSFGSDSISYIEPTLVVDSIRSTFSGTGSSVYTSQRNSGENIFFEVQNLPFNSNPELWDYLRVVFGSSGSDKEYECAPVSVESDDIKVKCF